MSPNEETKSASASTKRSFDGREGEGGMGGRGMEGGRVRCVRQGGRGWGWGEGL